MHWYLRLTTLAASLLVTAWAFPGCSSDEGTAGKIDSGTMSTGKMDGAMDKGKMGGGAMDKGKMDGAMDKGKMGGGAMESGKMDSGAMDKGKMDGTSK
jgi:hypothetical protein